jgi:cephalosporin hydroxylase
MRITIDTDASVIRHEDQGSTQEVPLYSPQGFDLLSYWWVKVGWSQKYSYQFAWFGRPIIQLPEDILRTQEVIWRVRPDVIVETGVAHGGSLIFYASLCKAMGRGRVIGIDIEIRPQNRSEIESHPLHEYITLVEGSSVDPAVVKQVQTLVGRDQTAMVLLDSDHSRDHVAAELEAYHGLVTPGSYIVATDGIMESVYDTPRGKPHWKTDNPAAAAEAFARRHPEFILEQPAWPFNESPLSRNITHWPRAWLRRS